MFEARRPRQNTPQDKALQHLEDLGLEPSGELPKKLVDLLVGEGNPKVYIVFEPCAGFTVHTNLRLGDLPDAFLEFPNSHRQSHHDPNKGQDPELCFWSARVFRAG